MGRKRWRYLQGAAAPGTEEGGPLNPFTGGAPPVAVARVLLLGLAGRESWRGRDSTRRDSVGRLGRDREMAWSATGELGWVGVLGRLLTQFHEPHVLGWAVILYFLWFGRTKRKEKNFLSRSILRIMNKTIFFHTSLFKFF